MGSEPDACQQCANLAALELYQSRCTACGRIWQRIDPEPEHGWGKAVCVTDDCIATLELELSEAQYCLKIVTQDRDELQEQCDHMRALCGYAWSLLKRTAEKKAELLNTALEADEEVMIGRLREVSNEM